jgi:hypothetical protein
VWDIFEGVVCLLGVAETFLGVNLGVLTALENLVVIDLSISYSLWRQPTYNSVNFWFKLGKSCALWEEHSESCSVPDMLGFKVLSLLNDLLFSLTEWMEIVSGSTNLVLFM